MIRRLVIIATLALACAAAANTLVQFRIVGYATDAYIEAELLDDEKPVTVSNFVRLIESGAFENMFFHRLATNFVIQGGGFRIDATGSFIEAVPNFGTITNEYNVGPTRSNVQGTIAMAKVGGDPDSATSQFFINLTNNAAILDTQNGGFTVFARVRSDTNSVISFWNTMFIGYGIVDAGTVFSNLPVNYIGAALPTNFNQLIYCDVTLLQVAVSNSAAGYVISWNGADGMRNIVEYTEQFSPPAWRELLTTNGTGSRLSVTDTNVAACRFYRVRVE